MRKIMTKEVKKTEVKMARLEMQDGQPVAIPMEDEVLLGNVTLEKAQKIMGKKYPGVTVLEVIPSTVTYQMEVEKFIQLADVKE